MVSRVPRRQLQSLLRPAQQVGHDPRVAAIGEHAPPLAGERPRLGMRPPPALEHGAQEQAVRDHETRAHTEGERHRTLVRRLGPRRIAPGLEQPAPCYPGSAREPRLVDAEALDRTLRVRQGLFGSTERTRVDVDGRQVAERRDAHGCPLLGQRRAQGFLGRRLAGGQVTGVVGAQAEVDVRNHATRRGFVLIVSEGTPGCLHGAARVAAKVGKRGLQDRRALQQRGRPVLERRRQVRLLTESPPIFGLPRLIEVERRPSPCKTQPSIGQHCILGQRVDPLYDRLELALAPYRPPVAGNQLAGFGEVAGGCCMVDRLIDVSVLLVPG
jgi:hypothetical protein